MHGFISKLCLLTFDLNHCEPSSKGKAISLDLTIVVAKFGVASMDDDGGIGICLALMSDANTSYRGAPLICATRRWIGKRTTMKNDQATNGKWTL